MRESKSSVARLVETSVVLVAILSVAAGCRTAPLRGTTGDLGSAAASAAEADPTWIRTKASYARVGARPTAWTRTAAAGGGDAKDGGGGGSDDLAKKIQNPIADLISLPIQANLDEGYGPEDHAWRWTINVQPVIPVKLSCRWNVISRTILPVVVRQGVLPGEDDVGGLGDTVQSLFFSPRGSSGPIWGAGPVFLFPTATDDALGAGRWGAGPTIVVLQQSGPWTVGILANHIWSFAEARSDAGPDVNATFVQPFLSYTFPSAFSVTLNTESTYDWEGGAWSVPINVSVAQVTKVAKQPLSLGLGLRYWAETPDGGPDWGIRLTCAFLFPK